MKQRWTIFETEFVYPRSNSVGIRERIFKIGRDSVLIPTKVSELHGAIDIDCAAYCDANLNMATKHSNSQSSSVDACWYLDLIAVSKIFAFNFHAFF